MKRCLRRLKICGEYISSDTKSRRGQAFCIRMHIKIPCISRGRNPMMHGILLFVFLYKAFFQHFRISGEFYGRLGCNAVVPIQIQKTGVHRNHIVADRRIQHAFDLRNFVIPDHISDSRSHGHNLKGRNHASV